MQAAATAGWHVFACDRLDAERPTRKTGSGLVTPIHLDVTVPDDINTAVDIVGTHVDDEGLDGLANTAGIGIPGPLEIMPLEQLRQSFHVDFFGQAAVTQAVLHCWGRQRAPSGHQGAHRPTAGGSACRRRLPGTRLLFLGCSPVTVLRVFTVGTASGGGEPVALR